MLTFATLRAHLLLSGDGYSGDRCMFRNYLVLIYEWLANVQKQSILITDRLKNIQEVLCHWLKGLC
jgi:hypothetical protein